MLRLVEYTKDLIPAKRVYYRGAMSWMLYRLPDGTEVKQVIYNN